MHALFSSTPTDRCLCLVLLLVVVVHRIQLLLLVVLVVRSLFRTIRVPTLLYDRLRKPSWSLLCSNRNWYKHSDANKKNGTVNFTWPRLRRPGSSNCRQKMICFVSSWLLGTARDLVCSSCEKLPQYRACILCSYIEYNLNEAA